MATKKMRRVKHADARHVQYPHERCIITDYFAKDGKTVLKRTWSRIIANAVGNVVKNMEENTYGAWSAVVYHDWTCEEYRNIHRSVDGSITIV